MQFDIFEINAFAEQDFSGNPAAVCILESWLPVHVLQSIAIQNALPATAFLVRHHDGFQTRWFAPEYEIDLCGHGSLASACVIFNFLEPSWNEASLYYSAGTLVVKKSGNLFTLDFPAKEVEIFNSDLLVKGLGSQPIEVYQYNNERCLVVYQSEEEVRRLNPDMTVLKNLEHRGIIVTASGKDYDFISRTFYPRKAVSEDAVTGSSHCLLIPYWSAKLNKSKLRAYQASHRGGEIVCEMIENRVCLSGKAQIYLQGKVFLNNIIF